MTRLAFVESPETLEGGLDADFVVATSHAAFARARELGVDCILEHALLTEPDVSGIQRDVAAHRADWADRWLGRMAAESLTFEGHRLDAFVDYELTLPLVEIFSALAIARNLESRVAPRSVSCDSQLAVQRHLVEACFRHRGVETVALPPAPHESSGAAAARRRVRARRSLRRARADRRLVRRARSSRLPVYLSAESPHTRALGGEPSSMTFLEHTPSRTLDLHGAYFGATPGARSAPWKLARLRRRLATAWEAAREAPYVVGGVDLAGALRPLARWLFTGVRPERRVYRSPLAMQHGDGLLGAARSALALEAMLRRARVRLVVLNQDSTQAGAVAALVARRLGIPSLVLQHGVTAEFYPLNADGMLLWGESGAAFYAKHGVEAARLFVVGSPLEAPRGPEPAGARGGGARPVRVVFIGQPYTGLNPMHPPHGPECHLHGFLAQAALRPDLDFLVRPHLLDDADTVQRSVRARSLHNVTVDRSEPLSEVIQGSRVIVVHNSTVGLEALQQRRRILMINFTGTPDLVPYAESPNCVAAYSPEAFGSALERELAREIPFVDSSDDPFVRRQLACTGRAAVAASHDAMLRVIEAGARGHGSARPGRSARI